MKTTNRNKNPKYESAPTIKTPELPISPEAIRLRAHKIFLARGGIPGRELEDWLLAEQELKQLAREVESSTT
jgi:hypothetical protein